MEIIMGKKATLQNIAIAAVIIVGAGMYLATIIGIGLGYWRYVAAAWIIMAIVTILGFISARQRA